MAHWKDLPASLAPAVGETVKDWHARIDAYAAANPGALTPLSAAALEDLEARARAVPYIVAASDAVQRVKDAADFVATGTNDHTVFQQAHDALPAGGGKIIGAGGTFNFAGTANITKPVMVELTADAKIRKTTGAWALDFKGSVATTGINLSADVAKGATTLTFASTTGLAVGDALNLRSDEVAFGATNPAGRKGEQVFVKSLTATVVTLTRGTMDSYTVATTARVHKITHLKGAALKGGTVTQDGPLNPGGIGQVRFLWCWRPRLEAVAFVGNEASAIEVENCWAARIVDPEFRDFTVNSAAGYSGYCITDRGASMHTHASGVYAIRTGNGFANGSSGSGIPRFGKVSNGISVETLSTVAWGEHQECEYTTYENCESHGASGEAFTHRGTNTVVINPLVRGCGGIGIYINDVSRGVRVYDPDVQGAGSHGIAIGGPTLATINATVKGGRITETGSMGININANDTNLVMPVVTKPRVNTTFKVCIRIVGGENNRIMQPVCGDAETGIDIATDPAYPGTRVVTPTFYNCTVSGMNKTSYAAAVAI